MNSISVWISRNLFVIELEETTILLFDALKVVLSIFQLVVSLIESLRLNRLEGKRYR